MSLSGGHQLQKKSYADSEIFGLLLLIGFTKILLNFSVIIETLIVVVIEFKPILGTDFGLYSLRVVPIISY